MIEVHYREFLTPKAEKPKDPMQSDFDDHSSFYSACAVNDLVIERVHFTDGTVLNKEWSKVRGKWKKTDQKLSD